MKRCLILLAPSLAFALAAVAAWLSGESVGKVHAFDGKSMRSPRHGESSMTPSVDLQAVADLFENKMLAYRPPAKHFHNPEEMEAIMGLDKRAVDLEWRSANFPGQDMDEIGYAYSWADQSPEEMFHWLISEGRSSSIWEVESILFKSWAEKDMEKALTAVFEIPDIDLRRRAFAASIDVLCKSDPTRARGLMVQNLDLFPPGLGDSLPCPTFGNEQALIGLYQSLPPGPERTHLLANLFRELASYGEYYEENQVDHVISAWNDAPETVRREWVEAGFSSSEDNAASFDGLEQLAREHVELSGDPKAIDDFIAVHGSNWAKRDLAGALEWSLGHLKGKNRVEMSSGLFEPAARRDFDNALQIWQTLPEGILKNRAARALSEGAPIERKEEIDSILQSLSGQGLDPK